MRRRTLFLRDSFFILLLLLLHEARRGNSHNASGSSPSKRIASSLINGKDLKENTANGSSGKMTHGDIYSITRSMSSKSNSKNDSTGHVRHSHGGDSDSSSKLPICFSTAQSRHEELAGSWMQPHSKGSAAVKPPYWDLSCFSEWSKYSCVHQGNVEHALNAEKYRFVPSECKLLDFNATDFTKRMSNHRIIFSGDSFIRQVLIAFSCLFEQLGMIDKTRVHVPWAACSSKWPCHGAKNCIECGAHSGFTSFDFSLHGASRHPQFLFLDENLHQGAVGSALSRDDIVFIEPGIHNTVDSATQKALLHAADHMKHGAKVVWMYTWPAHFATANGEYDVKALQAQQKASNGTAPSNCIMTSQFERKSAEAAALRDKTRLFDGVIWLTGIEGLGSAKVGGGAGLYGDCQHFCLPGPPDEIARVLYTYLMQTFA